MLQVAKLVSTNRASSSKISNYKSNMTGKHQCFIIWPVCMSR
uniref:Uncharacterized protein n=1 Tax=Arundo donax TaxID=35708 RepID=A0A0A8YTF2_ARUDO